METDSTSVPSTRVWRPLEVLFVPRLHPRTGVVLLNVSLRKNMRHLHRMWNASPFKLALDGAANHLHENSLMPTGDEMSPPDVISGDFDSVLPDILQSYKSQGVRIEHTPDQDETDFTKGLRLISTLPSSSLDALVVFGYNCGRFDQIIACFNSLFEAKKFLPNLPIYMVHATSVSFLLHPGRHEIFVDRDLIGQPCGLIPLGAPANRVTTSGLRWNLKQDRLAFGHLVSTSNTYAFGADKDDAVVTVETDAPLVWTMEILDRSVKS